MANTVAEQRQRTGLTVEDEQHPEAGGELLPEDEDDEDGHVAAVEDRHLHQRADPQPAQREPVTSQHY
jgi:hypothetical protein